MAASPTPPALTPEPENDVRSLLEPTLIQKYLFLNSDKIYNQLLSGSGLAPDINGNSYLFSKGLASKTIDLEQSAKLINNQHQLLSSNAAPTAESAIELFADPTKPNYYINGGYTIEHNLIFIKNNSKYKINIDRLNRQVNTEKDKYNGIGAKFIFTKASIVNTAKDSFTARTNFKVTLHIAFTFFEDLTESFEVPNLDSSGTSENFSIWNMLYPYYRKGQAVPSQVVDLRNGNGIILNQVLNMNSGEYFKKTLEGLDQNKQIHKNYHLTFYKHSINVFKSDDPILKSFDNELIIEYISYEADDQTNNEKDSNLPTTSDNMFKLLSTAKASDAIGKAFGYADRRRSVLQYFQDTVKIYNDQISAIETAIRCKEATPDSAKNILNQEEIGLPNIGNADFDEKAKQRIEGLQQNIDLLRQELKINLFRYIVNQLDIYTIKNVPRKNLASFKEAQFGTEFGKSFSNYFEAGVFLTLTAASLATGGVAALIIAGGAAATAGAAAIKAASTNGEAFSNGVIELRNKFSAQNIIKTSKGQFYDKFTSKRIKTNADEARTQTASNLDIAGVPSLNTGQIGQAAERQKEQKANDEKTRADAASVNEALKLRDQQERNSSSKENLDIDFILFGQLVDLIPKVNSSFVFGGKTLVLDKNLKSVYLNYYYTPIHLTKLLQFLENKIVLRNDFNYNSEVFLRDIVEELLKKAVKTDSTTSSLLKEFVPTYLNFNVTLVDKTKYLQDFFNSVQLDMTNEDNFKKAKKFFILSKNISATGRQKDTLQKVYTITADEEIKYFNFYKKFKEWKISKNKQNLQNTSGLFQEFIIEDFYIPCLRLKANDLYGSILKNKNISFSRRDNPNLITGQTLDNSSILRTPYTVTGQFKPYISFFVDVPNMLYVSPPDRRDGTIDTENIFGYSGLYLVTNSSFEYKFQMQDANGAITIPNENANYEISARLITFGDGNGAEASQTGAAAIADCSDPKPASPAPANNP